MLLRASRLLASPIASAYASCAPTAPRVYRHPATAEEAHLSAGTVIGPGGVLWWSVTLVRADVGVAAVAGQMPVAWWQTREGARG